MRSAATASNYERATRPYLYDRIEVSAVLFTGPRPGNYLRADFDRPTERVPFSILGAFYCEFPSGPHLGELAALAHDVCGADGFFGVASARRIDSRLIDTTADAEGWGIFDVDGSGLLEIERDDEADVFACDEDAVAFVREKAEAGSGVHIAAIRAHDDYRPALDRKRA